MKNKTPDYFFSLIKQIPGITSITINHPYTMVNGDKYSVVPPKEVVLPYFDLTVLLQTGEEIFFEHYQSKQMEDIYNKIKNSHLPISGCC